MQQSSHTPFVREFTSEPPQVSRQQGYQREILFTKSRQCAKENLTQNTSTLLDDQQNHCFSCWDWFERNVVVLKGMLAWKEYVKEHLTLERYLFSLFEIRETVLEESTVSKERKKCMDIEKRSEFDVDPSSSSTRSSFPAKRRSPEMREPASSTFMNPKNFPRMLSILWLMKKEVNKKVRLVSLRKGM